MIIYDIMDVLEAEGFGISGDNIIANSMIDEPNDVIVVTLLPGFPFSPKIDDVKYSLQVMVRDRDFDKAYTLITGIANSFDNGKTRFKVAPSGRKLVGSVSSAPSLVRVDESNRAVYTVGLHITTSRD